MATVDERLQALEDGLSALRRQFEQPRPSTIAAFTSAAAALDEFIGVKAGTNVSFSRDPQTGLLVVTMSTRRPMYRWAPDAAPGAQLSSGNQQGDICHSGAAGLTCSTMYVDCETACGVNGLTIQLQYGDTDDLDTVASWTEIASLALSSEKSKQTTSFTNGTVPASRLMRMNVTVADTTVRDVTVTLEGS